MIYVLCLWLTRDTSLRSGTVSATNTNEPKICCKMEELFKFGYASQSHLINPKLLYVRYHTFM